MRERPPDPLAATSGLIGAYGAYGRPLLALVALLYEGAHPLTTLIRETALPRRTVEALLTALGTDVEEDDDRWGIRPDRRSAYRERFGQRPRAAAGLGVSPTACAQMRQLISMAPAPSSQLDHVSATAETVTRRAEWLDGAYLLHGRRVLFVGDHDLTALATGLRVPGAEIMVVDVDERILEFIEIQAGNLGLRLRCLYADLRFGLPPEARAWADLAFTDPPYTPEGAALFALRAAQGLGARPHGRVVMAYGFADTHPRLGLKVQRAIQRLHIGFEAILPHFNRYAGAEALGSASDLYVCRPTALTWRLADRDVIEPSHNIYTRGHRAEEAGAAGMDPSVAATVLAMAADGGHPVDVVVGEGWPEAGSAARRVDLHRLITAGMSSVPHQKAAPVVAANLSGDPGSWLFRLLLAVNASRLTVLVPGRHPDLASQVDQDRLQALVRAKYLLRFRRSTPTPGLAVVEATAAPRPALDAGGHLVRAVLERSHGKTGNVWAEALTQSTATSPAAPRTRRAARGLVSAMTHEAEWLRSRPIDLTRYRLEDLVGRVSASVVAEDGGRSEGSPRAPDEECPPGM